MWGFFFFKFFFFFMTELLRYVQFQSSLWINVQDRTTALISRWDEQSILLWFPERQADIDCCCPCGRFGYVFIQRLPQRETILQH